MKKILIALALILTTLSSGCLDDSKIDKRADEILSQMTIKEKVGQLMFAGIRGTTVDEETLRELEELKPGGILLFDRNLQTEEQIKKLTSDLQKNSAIPMFIAIDEEGGKYSRARDIIEEPPTQKDLGETGDPKIAKDWAIKTARRLHELGINTNFAPVVDIGFKNVTNRSFGSDPKIVTDFVTSEADGYRQENLIFTLKHFPGIGRDIIEVNEELSVIDAPIEELDSADLLPFKEIIKNYPNDKFLIMVSHYNYPAIDPNNVASTSKLIVEDLLRRLLEFDGVVVTDNIEMGAMSQDASYSRVGAKAIDAGVDMALCFDEFDHEKEVYKEILNAVSRGGIPEKRINQSVKRILRTKISMGIIR